MDDTISRQAAIDSIMEEPSEARYPVFYAEKIRQLPSAQPEPRWIPVESEPPKEKKHYWVCTDTGYQCECRWTNNIYGFCSLRESDNWGWSIFDIPQYSKVVAYMPLPKPYERSKDE